MLEGRWRKIAVLMAIGVGMAGCGSSSAVSKRAESTPETPIPQGRPQAIQPTAGVQGLAEEGTDPVGDPHAHAPPLSWVKHQLQLQLVAVRVSNSKYINPLRY